jgi:predicted helicase
MFLSPRKSIVDVVQSVGRVMRKAPGKKYGYIILPIAIPEGVTPEVALRDNAKYQVVWEVLQALRAHDDRLNAEINKIDLTKRRSNRINVIGVGGGERGENRGVQGTLALNLSQLEEWRDAVYARIVQKVGSRRYWEDWAKSVAQIAEAHITRINALLDTNHDGAREAFDKFLDGLRANLNESITQQDAVEMLAQHLITRPVFDALFGGYDFAARNPVAQAMEQMLATLADQNLESENADLEKFYESVRMRVQGIDTAEGRQRIIVELYDTFFSTAFKRTVNKLGIVYTPVEIVDFIIRSADEVLRAEFGQELADQDVHILDGFTGTGTFMTRQRRSAEEVPVRAARQRDPAAGLLHRRRQHRNHVPGRHDRARRRAGLPAVSGLGPHRHLPELRGRRPARLRGLPGQQRPSRSPEGSADHRHRRQPALLDWPGLGERRQPERDLPLAGRRHPRRLLGGARARGKHLAL